VLQPAATSAKSTSKKAAEASEFYPFTIDITLEKKGKLGIVIGEDNEGFVGISEIKEGVMSKWNVDNPDLAVEVGDWIIDLNGKGGKKKAVMAEIGEARILNMRILKALQPAATSAKSTSKKAAEASEFDPRCSASPIDITIDITLDKGDQGKLGMRIGENNEGKIGISEIYGGVMLKWNVKNPDLAVEVGDWIIDINGISGSRDGREALMAELTTAPILEMRIQKDRVENCVPLLESEIKEEMRCCCVVGGEFCAFSETKKGRNTCLTGRTELVAHNGQCVHMRMRSGFGFGWFPFKFLEVGHFGSKYEYSSKFSDCFLNPPKGAGKAACCPLLKR